MPTTAPTGSSPRSDRAAIQAGPLAQKALEKLVALGPSAIEPIVDALTNAEKRETLAYVEALSRLIDSKTLPHLLKTMTEVNGRALSGIAWALSSSRNYPPSALLDALGKEGMPKQAILDVIAAQKARFTVRDLLNAAYPRRPPSAPGSSKSSVKSPRNPRSTI